MSDCTSLGFRSAQRRRKLCVESLETRAMLSSTAVVPVDTASVPSEQEAAALLESDALTAEGGANENLADVAAAVPTTSGVLGETIASSVVDEVLSATDFSADDEIPVGELAQAVIQVAPASAADAPDFTALQPAIAESENSDLAAATLSSSTVSESSLSASLLFTMESENEPPIIFGFYCVNEYGDWWTLIGFVEDPDDFVVGNVVFFGGVLEKYNLMAVVDESEGFALTVELVGLESGIAWAQTMDPHGALSNEAPYYMDT